MELGVSSGKRARCVRGLHNPGQGRTGIQQKAKGDGRFCDVISSRIIFDRLEKSGVWAQGALRFLDLPVVLTQHTADLGAGAGSRLFQMSCWRSLSKYQGSEAPGCLPLPASQTWAEPTVLHRTLCSQRADILLWKPSRKGNSHQF